MPATSSDDGSIKWVEKQTHNHEEKFYKKIISLSNWDVYYCLYPYRYPFNFLTLSNTHFFFYTSELQHLIMYEYYKSYTTRAVINSLFPVTPRQKTGKLTKVMVLDFDKIKKNVKHKEKNFKKWKCQNKND